MGGDIVGAVQDGFMSRYERAAPFTFAMAFANFYLVTRAAPHRIPEPSPTPWEWECRLPRVASAGPTRHCSRAGGRCSWQVPASTQLLVLNLTSLAWSIITVLI